MLRDIKYIVLHCTASSQSATISAILRYWKDDRGWKNPGYHFIIEANGNVVQLQPIEKPSNGVRGYNQSSIHVSYIGGKDGIDDRTNKQKIAMAAIVKVLHAVHPTAKILGHRDFPNVAKACPSFEVKQFLKEINL